MEPGPGSRVRRGPSGPDPGLCGCHGAARRTDPLFHLYLFPRGKRTDSGPVSERHPELCLERPRAAGFFSEGRPEWAESVGSKEQRDELRKTVRIWPHKTGGEGHFMALFVKNGDGAGDSGGMEPDRRQKDGREEKGRRKEGQKSQKGSGRAYGGSPLP